MPNKITKWKYYKIQLKVFKEISISFKFKGNQLVTSLYLNFMFLAFSFCSINLSS